MDEIELLLNDIISLLLKHEETHWSQKLEKLRAELRDGIDVREGLLEVFGGMGSFNDLIISTSNGHKVNPFEGRRANCRLNNLREKLYEELWR